MIRKTVMTLVLSFIFVFNAQYVFSQSTPMLSLEEVEKLLDLSRTSTLKAHFDTVNKGSKIESMDITLRGVIRQPGLEIIMFTSKHKIAAGMSGSPVYLNGNLIGAISYSIGNFSSPSWGGITPISTMLREDKAGRRGINPVSSFSYNGMTFVPIATGYEELSGIKELEGQKFVQVSSVVGSLPANSWLKNPVLKPGMPIVVNIIEWTDENGKSTSVGSAGTITYIDDDGRIFAFGHPFLDSKNVVYAFRTAEVIGTVVSQDNSFKVVGRTSDILGTISYDAANGIYGKTGLGNIKNMRHFNLEFKNQGQLMHRFDVKVADSIMTPMLARVALELIGRSYGAPLPQATSVTQIEADVHLDSYDEPISWSGLYASGSFTFGPETVYVSSYGAACDSLFAKMLSPFFVNNYNLNISDVSVSVNFIPGARRTYKLGGHKFPNKVVYGQDPVLDIMFVDENNLMPIVKKVQVKIDWSKVERPVYTADVADIDKVAEKVVGGVLRIQSSNYYVSMLTSEEKQRVLPEYFLGPGDYLSSLSRSWEITNQNIFVKIGFRSRSGLFDETLKDSGDIMPDITADSTGWIIMREGLKERKITLKNEGAVFFDIPLPKAPIGYVFDKDINETIMFEVVLDK